MSYARSLQCLVVEDDEQSKHLYQEIFEELQGDDPTILQPHYAFSVREAERALAEPTPYHLVVLDLRLPQERGKPPEEHIATGQQILEMCRTREAYPVPALLVVTAFAGSTSQSKLRESLVQSFSYAQLLSKGGELLEEFRTAVDKVRQYTDIGLHVHDGKQERFPALSPREEDLLRRAALKNNATCLDLRWWSASFAAPSGPQESFKGWTKVLMGHFLLGGALGRSRSVFCKFLPAAAIDAVVRDAQLLERKLQHVKVAASVRGGERSLLITEKTGPTLNVPVAMEEYLGRRQADVAPHIASIAKDVLDQLDMLGQAQVDLVPLNALMWRFHDEGRIAENRDRHGRHPARRDLAELCSDASLALQALKHSSTSRHVEFRSCVHGDMNVTNVAIDIGGDTHAYIFDASNVRRDMGMRDIAMLEVTALLHLPSDCQELLVANCARVLYGAEFVPARLPPTAGERAANTVSLIRELRSYAAARDQTVFYAIAVLDAALGQVGGLSFPSNNKVRSFLEAVLLADLAAGWLVRMAPDLVDVPRRPVAPSPPSPHRE